MTPENPQAVKINIGTGQAATRATLAVMAKIAVQYSKNANIRQFAAQLVSHLAARDYSAEAQTISNYVRDNIRFLRDPVTAELLQLPDYTLAVGYGDCDDKVTLLAALFLSIGLPVRFVAVGPDVQNFQHVYLEVNLAGDWVPDETAAPQKVLFGTVAPQAAAFPAILRYDVATNSVTLGDTDVRGTSVYGNPPLVSLSALQSAPAFSQAQARAFLAPFGSSTLESALETMFKDQSPGQLFVAIYTGGGPWVDFQTDPPMPVNDLFIYPQTAKSSGYVYKNGVVTVSQPANVSGGGGGGIVGGGGGGQHKQLQGLGDPVYTPVSVNYYGSMITGYMGSDSILIIPGNTNGNIVDSTSWLYDAIKNGKAVAGKSWVTSPALISFFQENISHPSAWTGVFDVAVAVASAIGISEAASALGAGSAEAGGGAGAGAGGGAGSSVPAGFDYGDEAAQQIIANPLTTIDTSGLTALQPLDLATLGTEVGTGAGVLSTASQIGSGAGIGSDLLKLGTAVGVAGASSLVNSALAPNAPGSGNVNPTVPGGASGAAPAAPSGLMNILLIAGLGIGALLVFS